MDGTTEAERFIPWAIDVFMIAVRRYYGVGGVQRKQRVFWIAGIAVVTLAALVSAGEAQAQIGGIGPVVPGGFPDLPVPSGTIDRDIGRLPGWLNDEVLAAPDRVGDLIRRSDGALQADPQGWPVVRSEIVVIDLDADARAWALAQGYILLREERLEALDLTTVILAPPPRMRLGRAVDLLRRRYPALTVEYNHVFSPAGTSGGLGAVGAAALAQSGGGVPLGLIDTGVDASHPVFSHNGLTQRGFAGPMRPGPHGTAVASLMVGRADAFSGAWPGADLLVADIYGGRADGGASTAFVQALDWLISEGALVVNVSLVGPRNSLMERAVQRAQARGVTLVAAVGNDGPAASPLFPAAYEGVIGVSAVSESGRVLPEAGRGAQVDFSGPGADMAAASPGGGYTTVRGTSFASPIIAAIIARNGGGRAGISAAARAARDLGPQGADTTYGAGLVGGDVRTDPDSVGARGRLQR